MQTSPSLPLVCCVVAQTSMTGSRAGPGVMRVGELAMSLDSSKHLGEQTLHFA